MSAPIVPGQQRRTLIAVATALFAINIGFGVIGPLAPQLALQMGGGAALVATMFSLFSAARVVVQLPGGIAADRIGDGRLLLLALLLYALATAAMARVTDPLTFTTLRAVEGVAAGLAFPAASSLVLRTTAPDRLGRAIGWVAGGSALGLIAGPLLGGVLLRFGLRVPLWASAGVCLAVLLLVAPALGRAPLAAAPLVASRTLRCELRRLTGLLRRAGFFAALCPIALNKLLISGLEPLLPLYGPQVLGIDLQGVTLLFAGTAVIYAATQPLGGWMADHLSLRRQILALMALMLLALAALDWTPGLAIFLPVYATTIAAMSLVFAAALKQIGLAHGDQVGAGQLYGVVGLLTDAAMMAGPPLTMALFSQAPGRVFGGTAALGLVALVFVGAYLPPSARRTGGA